MVKNYTINLHKATSYAQIQLVSVTRPADKQTNETVFGTVLSLVLVECSYS